MYYTSIYSYQEFSTLRRRQLYYIIADFEEYRTFLFFCHGPWIRWSPSPGGPTPILSPWSMMSTFRCAETRLYTRCQWCAFKSTRCQWWRHCTRCQWCRGRRGRTTNPSPPGLRVRPSVSSGGISGKPNKWLIGIAPFQCASARTKAIRF